MATSVGEEINVGSLDDLKQRGNVVLPIGGHGVVVFYHEGHVYALDNRCPHMGFPLSSGTVRDGLLTCHWHHARFDLCSGGTLDPFADNVRSYPVRVDDGQVWLDPRPARVDERAHWEQRLNEGLQQNLNLVIAKAVLGLLASGAEPASIVAIGGRHGTTYRQEGWGSGMTILTAIANVLPLLAAEDQPLALYHGLVRVAEDSAGHPPHFGLEPLPETSVEFKRLKFWFRRSVQLRDAEGAERILQTAIASGAEPAALADMLFASATDHWFVDGGHTIDFINKACEYLDLAGWQNAPEVLGSLIGGLVTASRSEEQNAWRYPVDLVALVAPETHRLPGLMRTDLTRPLGDLLETMAWTVLGDDPQKIIDTLVGGLEAGISPADLGQVIAYAAALRLARFHTSNEYGDWETVHNTWSACNALHQALRRAPSPELARGILHAAMRIYLDRFLNIPAARLPDQITEGNYPTDVSDLPTQLLDLMDREQQVNPAGRLIDAYLAVASDPTPLVRTLGHAVLREDAGFHMYQTLEAGLRQFSSLWPKYPLAARRVLVGVGRYLAAHAPTQRAMGQTATIAARLQRGEELFQETE